MSEVPGSAGPPVLGSVVQTVEFLRGWHAYFARRRARFGGVFRTNVGGPAVTLLDAAAVRVALDAGKVRKRYGFGPRKPPPELVGNIVPVMFENDEAHAKLKGFVLGWMRSRAAELPVAFDRAADAAFARWSTAGGFDAGREIEALLADAVFQWMVGATADPADLRTWIDDLLAPRFAPWRTDKDRQMAEAYTRLLGVVRAGTAFEAAAAAGQAAGLDPDATARHLLFVSGFNAWSGLRGLLASFVAEMALQPALADEIADEVGATPRSWAELAGLGTPGRAVLEVLRTHPPAPIVFGEARQSFAVPMASGEATIAAGELVMSVLSLAQRDPAVLEDPDAFRPARFTDAALVGKCLFWAGGPDERPPETANTVCPGRDVVPAVARAFAARWTRYRVELKEPPRWSQLRMVQANRPETALEVLRFSAR